MVDPIPLPRPIASLSLLAVSLILSSCGEEGGDFEFRTQPPTEAAVGELWRYVPRFEDHSLATLTIIRGPAGMFVDDDDDDDDGDGDDEHAEVMWTPTLADLGEHVVILEAEGVEEEVQTFVLRVHQDLELGVTLSPRGHTHSSTVADFVDHYMDREHGRVIGFHGPWRASVAEAGKVPEHALRAVTAARDFGFIPAVGIGWADGAGNPDLTSDSSAENTWLNAETRAEFREMATMFAMEWQPPYLFLGNETNVYFESHTRAEWDAWVSEFEECYEAVKAVSPGTIVFTTFQLEFLRGLGRNAGWAGPARWELLDNYAARGKLDAIGFTTYPYFEYARLADLPATYWAEIPHHWKGKVIFTEVAWPATPHFPYPGNGADQQDFVDTFLDGVADLDVEYATWLFLHDSDQETSVPSVASTGLRDNLGLTLRTTDAAWKANVILRQRPPFH